MDNSIRKLSKKPRVKKIQISSRRSVIPSFLVGVNVFVHTGRDFKKVKITREKVGYKFGEFCNTRRFKIRN